LDPVRDPVEELRAFGLSTYEANAYVAALTLGAAEASAIAQEGNVPTGRIYDVLNGLVEKRILLAEDGRPKKYRAVPPSEALSQLLAARKRDFDERYQGLTRVATDLERRMSPRKRDEGSIFYRVLMGEEASRSFLAEKALEARKEIQLTLQFTRPMEVDEKVFAAYAAAAEQGVRVRAIVPDMDIPRLLESPYNELIARQIVPHLGRGIDVRVVDGAPHPFAIVDREKALVAVKNPLDAESYFALVYVWDPAFARELAGRFELLWSQGGVDVGDIAGTGAGLGLL
jgi:sugar-specific transcriptional regulator TrmB